VEYRVLGPLEVRGVDGPLELGGAKQRALLALLVLNANRVVARERLIDALWGEDPPETAVTTVQVYVSRLRKLLGAEALVTRAPGYLLAADPKSVDVQRFERLRAEGRASVESGECEAGALAFREALALWRGSALAEFEEPFAQIDGARLEDLRLAALEERIDADLQLGREGEVIGELESLIAEHPHREHLRELSMVALYRAGRQAEALEAYRDARLALDELGIEPGERLRLLERSILEQDPSLASPSSSRQPSGTVTLVFTGVEGSTRLLGELGQDAYRELLSEHRRIVRAAFAGQGGYEVDSEGDAFFYAFASGAAALTAVEEALEGLAATPIRIRVGMHTGEPGLDPPTYVGLDVHQARRIMSAGHGGQVLLSGTTRELVDGELLDLGAHRLKDFAEPVSLYQLGVERFPPLRTMSNTNLPAPLSSFVGRKQEVADVLSLIREGPRLLTLAGPGGTGKTRLALEAAGELVSEFGAGVFWIGLAPVRDPSLVVETIAQTLGAKLELAAHVGDKQLLLVLDNLEQVVESAVELAALLRACPNLRLLVTSRELLRVDGEVVYPVPALAEPEAAELFCARARIEPDDAVAELCDELDNLPLALELAAARVSVLTPTQILERMTQRLDLFRAGRGADPRQQTLRATISWSYELLSADEQRLFARMAVFRGGCMLEAAEEICGADVDAIASLVDRSLIRHRGDRYWMLQTIREYARELLDESGEADAVRGRHAEHYLALAEIAYTERFDRDLRRLAPENDNWRAALDHLRDQAPSQYLQLAGALGVFWLRTLQLAEGAQRLEDALASARDEGPHTARALTYLGELDMILGQFSVGVSRLEEAVQLWRDIGDETALLETLNALGRALYQADERLRALELFERTLELARSVGHDTLLAWSLGGVCLLLLATGEFERAEPIAEELRRNGQDIRNALHYLADCAQHRRDYALAEQYRLSVLESDLAAGNEHGQIIEVFGLAMIAGGLGRDEDAVHLEGAVEARWEELEIGSRPRILEAFRERDLGAARARLGEPRATAAYDEGRAMAWEKAVELALGKKPD
jgi:predicted ATPase/DNA-binding SARP family transcriptional activator